VLLVTLLELMESGYTDDNRFYPDAELVGVFQENWRLLVDTAHDPDFTQPFFHLQRERIDEGPYWELVTIPSYEMDKPVKSINKLAEVVNYGRFSNELFFYLSIAENRALVKQLLIQTYFPHKAGEFVVSKEKGMGYYHDLEAYILNAPEARKKMAFSNVWCRKSMSKLVPYLACNSGAPLGIHLWMPVTLCRLVFPTMTV
jgi:putative restriction endonuclease